MFSLLISIYGILPKSFFYSTVSSYLYYFSCNMFTKSLFRKLSGIINQKACISFSCCDFKAKDGREANVMKKFLASKSSKKKFYMDDRTNKNVLSVINDPNTQRRTPMRVSVLNKLFMTSITDILATGGTSDDLIGRGIEITNVSVNKDYQLIKVYWTAKSIEDEIWCDNNLQKIAYSLRHDLSQLHVMGNVPRIQFFRDKRNSQLASVDALITTCDKGPDDDSDRIDDIVTEDDIMPVMTNNVYGLQYDSILSRLITLVNKAKAPHRKRAFSSVEGACLSDPTVISKYNQKESIRKFLLMKKLNEEKLKKKYVNFDYSEVEVSAVEDEYSDNRAN